MSALSLVVAAGPDTGQRVTVQASATATVGRGQGQTLQLSDTAVSRQHLTLRADGDALVVEQITGVNPVWTLIEGRRVDVTAGTRFAAGQTLTLGGTTLRVEPAPQKSPSGSTLEIDARLAAEAAGPDRLASLAALGDKLARCDSLQAVFREACSWAIGALSVSRAMLISPDGRDILGASTDTAKGDLAMSRTLLDRVLSDQRAFLVSDVKDEPGLADKKSVIVRGIVGAMAAPTEGLVFYLDWGMVEATKGVHDERALLLLVCAAHLVSAMGASASERSQLQAAARTTHAPGRRTPRMIGQSAAMQRLQVFIERVASSNATVLLHGESGTGKELAAGMTHAMSSRSSGPFVAVNCAAIPENLLESELFGHEKGAFTGAVAQHDGVFSRADGGTLFLDEIGEMSLATQARMLRVLETQTFTRVGGTKETKVSVRLVAATHRDLRQMVAEGKFREDLLYRLSVIQT